MLSVEWMTTQNSQTKLFTKTFCGQYCKHHDYRLTIGQRQWAAEIKTTPIIILFKQLWLTFSFKDNNNSSENRCCILN